MPLITIIGRGHSGTRTISHTLYGSGVFMGKTLNASGDKVPPQAMYRACRILARSVTWLGGLEWDFSALHEREIAPEFEHLVREYLADILSVENEPRGWKLPETTLAYPWIVRIFPDARYVYLVRDPRDCIINGHLTDDLSDFGIEYPETDDVRQRRAISWKYQYDIVASTPRPRHFLTVRFEDFVLQQERTLRQLEDFLGIPLARIVVRPESVGRWKTDTSTHLYDFFRGPMIENGYTDGLDGGSA